MKLDRQYNAKRELVREFFRIELKVRGDDFCLPFVILRFVCAVLRFHWLIGWVNVEIRCKWWVKGMTGISASPDRSKIDMEVIDVKLLPNL